VLAGRFSSAAMCRCPRPATAAISADDLGGIAAAGGPPSPIFPNVAEDGITYPRCQRRSRHTQPTVSSFRAYACRKIRSTDRQ